MEWGHRDSTMDRLTLVTIREIDPTEKDNITGQMVITTVATFLMVFVMARVTSSRPKLR